MLFDQTEIPYTQEELIEVDGHHLSRGEEAAKQALLLVCLALLIVLLYSSLLLWGAFRLLQDPGAPLT